MLFVMASYYLDYTTYIDLLKEAVWSRFSTVHCVHEYLAKVLGVVRPYLYT